MDMYSNKKLCNKIPEIYKMKYKINGATSIFLSLILSKNSLYILGNHPIMHRQSPKKYRAKYYKKIRIKKAFIKSETYKDRFKI